MEDKEKQEPSKEPQSPETPKDLPFKECPFEKGATKVYISLEVVVDFQHNRRQLTQVGCLNGKTGETMYTCILPSPQLVSLSTKKLLKHLPWVNVVGPEGNKSEQAKETDKAALPSNKAVMANIRSAPKEVAVSQLEALSAVLKFIRVAKADNTEVALVVYTKQEFRELILALIAETKGDSNLLSDLRSLVASVGVYENHLSAKVGSKPVHLEPLRSSKEGHEHASMPANTLVKFLREMFVKEDETEAVYSLIPLTENVPQSCIKKANFKTRSGTAQFLIISPVHISYEKRDWISGATLDPKKIDGLSTETLGISSGDLNSVTAFKVGLFGFHQPVVLKFKDIEDTTNTVEYSTELNGYKGEGSTKLHDYNSVKFAIVNLEQTKAQFYKAQDPNLDFHVKRNMKVLPEDSNLVKFSQKSQVLGPEQVEETVKVELFYNSRDPTTMANLMQANPTSILVDMVSTSTKEFSMSDVFMLANTKNQNKNFSVVNKLFCVLEEKSTLARMVLLPECGTKLTPGQSIGHAVLVNKQNFGEALVAAFLMDIEVNVILAHNREERRKEAREQDNVLARAREVHDRRGERNTDNRRGKFVKVRGKKIEGRGKHSEGPGRPFKRFKTDDEEWKNNTSGRTPHQIRRQRPRQHDHKRPRGSNRGIINDRRRDNRDDRGDFDSYTGEDAFNPPHQEFPGPDDSDLFTRREDLRHSENSRRDDDRNSRIPHRDSHRYSANEDTRSYYSSNQYNPPGKPLYK